MQKNTNNNQLLYLLFYTMFLFSFLANYSCTREVNIDIPKHEPEPVLNCLFANDSIFKVHLGMSSSILGEPLPITGGEEIKLYGNSTFIESLVWENEVYVSSTTAQTNVEYQIEWENGGNKITSSDFTPEQSPIESASYRDSVGIDEFGDKYSECTVTFTDNPHQKNYYEISLFIHYTFEGENITSGTRLFSSDPIINAEGLDEFEPNDLIFSDEMINGQTHELKLNYFPYRQAPDIDYSLIVRFRSVSENYYNYSKALLIHLFYQESNIWNSFGSPVPMFTNIEDGYGIFAGYSEDIDTITYFEPNKYAEN
jgi:hypothetical protein